MSQCSYDAPEIVSSFYERLMSDRSSDQPIYTVEADRTLTPTVVCSDSPVIERLRFKLSSSRSPSAATQSPCQKYGLTEWTRSDLFDVCLNYGTTYQYRLSISPRVFRRSDCHC